MKLVYWYSITLGVQLLCYIIMLHLIIITVFNPLYHLIWILVFEIPVFVVAYTTLRLYSTDMDTRKGM
jgi:hypothetical protein